MKGGRQFFNVETGSKVSPCKKLKFSFDDFKDMNIRRGKLSPPQGTFSLVGQIKWSNSATLVDVFGEKKSVRDGKFLDENNDVMNVSIWNTPLIETVGDSTTYRFNALALTNDRRGQPKLTSTKDTSVTPVESAGKFEWAGINYKNDHQLCCPEVIAVKINSYLQCRTMSCKRKINETSAETVFCHHCQRTIATNKCIKMPSYDRDRDKGVIIIYLN